MIKSYIEEASNEELIDAFTKSNLWSEFYINLGYKSRTSVSTKGTIIAKNRLAVLGLDFTNKFKKTSKLRTIV